MRRLAGLILVVGLGVTACSDDVEVGREEAIELLVLDGVERDKAVCIVDRIRADVDLARVTGVDPSITEDELAQLAAVTAGCRIVGDEQPTVVDDDSSFGPGILEGGSVDEMVEARVDDLMTGGLAPAVARCAGAAILASSDPAENLDDETFVAEAIRICSRSAEPTD